MKSLSLNSKKIEILLYVLMWTLIFSMPYLSERSAEYFNWNSITRHWLNLCGYLFIFFINVYILLPRLLFKKRYLYYFISVFILILLIIAVNIIIQTGIPLQSISEINGFSDSFRPPERIAPLRRPVFMIFADNFIICILTVGFGATIKLMTKWLSEEKLRKDMEKEQLKTNLALLRNQLSPHFLFNNLSVLTSLVHKNQDQAIVFINELSKVYRYVLDNKSTELATLQEELNFLDHYIYLQKIRFDNGISFIIKIEETKKSTFLPPMCLQMLVENTIQHNEISKANPLEVSIYTHKNSLIVENPIQLRSDFKESSKTGLKNIQSRYSFFTDEKVEIINDGKYFKVVLPLIGKE